MQDQLTLRAAKLADIGQVDDLLARSYPRLLRPDYPPSMLVLALPLITKAQPALLRSGRYFVVEDGDRVVAAGGWKESGFFLTGWKEFELGRLGLADRSKGSG